MKINMSHGSGGKATGELIRDVFSERLGNGILDRMEDAAVFPLDFGEGGADPGKANAEPGGTKEAGPACRMAYTTDSFVVSPIVFKGGDIGRLSVCGTVNDLLCMGAAPKAMTAGFIIEEGLDTEVLEQIASSMACALEEAGTRIVAADTKVVEGSGGLYINTSGIGIIPEGVHIGADTLEEGDEILVSGTLGDHHACILSHRMEIENDIKSDVAPLNQMVGALLDNHIRVKAMRDITRGGLATVLNELCRSSGVSALVDHRAIPVSESVRGLCGILGLDPFYMGNEGKLLIVVHPEDKDRALKLIRSSPYGGNAVHIGSVGEGSGVFATTDTGSTRRLNVLYGEGLPRIC